MQGGSSTGLLGKNLPKPDVNMLQIAEKIIAQQEAKFDPSQFKDRYEDALRALINRKKKGRPVTAEDEVRLAIAMEAGAKPASGAIWF